MKNENLLSVVVPVYNAEIYLERCIDSILSQTYNNIELLLINDGSSDRSPVICDKYKDKDNRVRVFHEKNRGPSVARNIGISNAHGRFIAFVDSDDYLEPFMYKSLIDDMENHNAGMAVCRWITHEIESNQSTISEIGNTGLFDSKEAMRLIYLNDVTLGGGFPWNRVIDLQKLRQSCPQNVFFPERIHVYEDKCYVIDCLSYLDSLLVTDIVGYHYQVHNGSLTSRSMNEKLLDVAKACNYSYETITRMNALTPIIQSIYEERMTSFLVKLRHQDYEEGRQLWYTLKRNSYTTKVSLKHRIKCTILWWKYSFL